MSNIVQLPNPSSTTEIRAYALALVVQAASAMASGIAVTEAIDQADQLAIYIIKGKVDNG